MKIVLLFALLGVAFALTPNKQYKYKYEGRIGLGLPEIRNRAAGTGLQCTVNVQVQSKEDIMIKLEDIKVGEYIGDVGCHMRQPLPIKWDDIQGDGKLLGDAYLIHIHKEQDDVMLVTKSDKEWITNIRKSIAGLFLIDPLRNEYPRVEGKGLTHDPYHRTKEPSVFGRCEAEYTLIKRNDSRRNEEENWEMTRNVNFDACDESAVFQHTSIGNTSTARENQFADVSSRSFKTSANLTYDGHSYDIRDSITEGYVIVNAFGLDHDKMMAITNQTLHLESVVEISSKWVLPSSSKSIRTWYMESSSPFKRSESSPLWVNFKNEVDDLYRPLVEESITTGIEISDQDIQKFKSLLDARLEAAAAILRRVDKPVQNHDIGPFDSDSAVLVGEMEAAFRAVRALDDKATDDLFEIYYKNQTINGQLKYRLLVDTIAASGTGGPLRVFVDQALKGKISVERAASVFFTLPNTLYSTPALPDLERYVKSLDLNQDSFATATVWINYANTLNRVCLNERRYQYSTPHELFGTKECNTKIFINSILPFYQDKLEKSKEDWERIVIIHAIGNLGTVQAYSTLTNIVTDRGQSDIARVTAIYGLARNKLPDEVRANILKILRPIVERKDENAYVRQASIIAILSWKPSPSFYQSLAAATWNEPSNNMASFMYYILKSYSESTDPAIDKQTKVAKFFLPIAKPCAPSFRTSETMLYSRYTQQDQLATDFDVSWLKRDRVSKSFTEEIFAFLVNSYGGLRFSVAQGSFSFNRESLHTLLQHFAQVLPQAYKNVRSSEQRRAQQELVDLQKRMSYQRKSRASDYSIAFLSLFDNMEFLLPLSKDSVEKALGRDGSIRIIKDLLEKKEFHGIKFINTAPITISLPTGIGLPLLVKVSIPTVNGGEANVTLTADGKDVQSISQLLKAKEIRLHMQSNYRFATKTFTMLKALIPWTSRSALVAVEALKAVILPANFSLGITRSFTTENVTFAFIPNHYEEFPIVQIHTVPIVAVKTMWPGVDPYHIKNQENGNKCMVVSLLGDKAGSVERDIKLNLSYTGMDGRAWYEGDHANPYNLGSFTDLMRHPEEIPSLFASPTCRMFESGVNVNFGKSPTKEIHASFAFRLGPLQTDEEQQRIQVLPDLELETRLLLNGTETRQYKVEIHLKHHINGEKKLTTLSLNHSRSSLPHFDYQQKMHCVIMKRSAPKIKTIDDLRNLLQQQDVETEYKGSFRGGETCNERQIVDFTGKMVLDETRRKQLLNELEEDCNSDPNNPMVSFNTEPVYDEAIFDVFYQVPFPLDILNATYHLYDYLRGLAFPHIYFNYMDQKNPEGEISLRGRRYIGENEWELQANLPTESVKLDRLVMPKKLEQIVPFGGLSHNTRRVQTTNLVVEPALSNDCVITKYKIRAFDGFSYSYTSDYCDTNAVVHQFDRAAPYFMSALDYESGNLKGLIGSIGTGNTLLFNSSELWLNDDEIGLTRQPKVLRVNLGKYFAEALKTPQYIEVRIPGNFTVRVANDKITITPFYNMHRLSGGLCGTYSGAINVELIGEKGCIYTDPTLFAHSWADFRGVGCEWEQFEKNLRAVKEFRKHCPRLPNDVPETSILKYSSVPSDCIEFVYKIKKNGSALCISRYLIPICYPLCKLDKSEIFEDIYSCWTEASAPKELARNLKRGFMRHKIHHLPEVSNAFKTEHAIICSKK